MAVLNREDLMNRIQARIGDDTSEDTLTFLEDLTDTLDDYDTRSSGAGGEDWKAKYDELDKTWKQKYRDRFFGKADENEDKKYKKPNEENDNTDTDTDEEEPSDFEDLFTESEVK